MPSLASGKPRPTGVPGLTLCRINLPAPRPAPHNVIPGSLGERDAVCSPGDEAGRRRAIGVVVALPNPRSAGERVRPSSRSEDGSDRSQARVGRGAQGALAINPRATTPMVRRWAAETP